MEKKCDNFNTGCKGIPKNQHLHLMLKSSDIETMCSSTPCNNKYLS